MRRVAPRQLQGLSWGKHRRLRILFSLEALVDNLLLKVRFIGETLVAKVEKIRLTTAGWAFPRMLPHDSGLS